MRRRSFTGFIADTSAATSIEYAMIAALISIIIVAGATAVGTKLSANYYGPVAGNLP